MARRKKNIHWTQADSTSIDQYGYCAATKTLGVKFKNGSTYHYPNVPATVFEAIQKAPSKGKAVNTHIRGLKFEKQ